MLKAKPVLLSALGILLLTSATDCLSLMSASEQSMECCATMPCTPANQAQDCCKAMTSGQTQYFQPAAKASVQPPLLIGEGIPTAVDLSPIPAIISRLIVDPNEHAPPQELYTVYLSLLI